MFRSIIVRRMALPTVVGVGILLAATSAAAESLGDPPAPPAEAAPAQPGSPPSGSRGSAPPPVDPTSVIRERMLTFTTKSPDTLDMRGVEPSLYRGTYYRASVEKKRRCVAKRESEGFYDVVSHDGYFGAYQMSPELARGATWMMLREHKRLLGESVAKRTLAKLRATPVNQWPRYWQDAAFSTVYNWKHTGSGAKHWKGGRWRC